MKNPLKNEDITLLLHRLNIKPIKIVRGKEAIWKENYKVEEMNDEKIIEAIVNHTQLMQRSIISNRKNALICTAPEKVLVFFI